MRVFPTIAFLFAFFPFPPRVGIVLLALTCLSMPGNNVLASPPVPASVSSRGSVPGFPEEAAKPIPPSGPTSWPAVGSASAAIPAQQTRHHRESIFKRFSDEPERLGNRFRLFEVPVSIRPQTQADAEIEENLGLGYVVGFFPRNTIFTAFGFNLARIAWRPEDPEITSVEVKQFDITQSLNFRIKRTFAISIGLGLGLMDALVLYPDGSFDHQLIPYIPFQIGVVVPLGDAMLLSLRGVHTPYFGDGEVIGHGRVVVGLGYYY